MYGTFWNSPAFIKSIGSPERNASDGMTFSGSRDGTNGIAEWPRGIGYQSKMY